MKSLISTCSFLLLGAFASLAFAQAYPAKPVRIVVGFSPGGPVDVLTRVVGQRLTEILGQPFIIEFKEGAADVIGTTFLTRAAPDGHTLVVLSASHTTNPSTRRSLPFDSLKDLSYISPIAYGDNTLVVNPKLPIHSIKDLVTYAKANPGKLNFGSTGIGSSVHLGGELFKLMAGVDMVHVPYKGGSPAILAVVSGSTDLVFLPLPLTGTHINAGNVRILGVASLKRSRFLPNVPTLDESGLPKFEVTVTYGLAAPAATPRPIITRLNDAMKEILNRPDVIKTLTEMQLTPWYMTPDQFTTWIREDIDKWAGVTKAIKFQPE